MNRTTHAYEWNYVIKSDEQTMLQLSGFSAGIQDCFALRIACLGKLLIDARVVAR